MNRIYLRALVAALCIVIAGQCQAQELDLSFDGSCGNESTLAPGAVQAVSFDCVLTTSNNPLDAGAQGWSISVAARGGTITGITTDGTAAAMEADGGLRGGGFEKSETTSESGVATGGNNDCEGLNGAVSAIVLSFESPVTLDAEGSAVIARIDVEAAAPDSHGDCNGVEVFFADGCRGAGQPVRNAITLDTRTFIPALGRCDFNVCSLPPEDCSSEGDEDQNGLADCEDPACAEDPACVVDDGDDGDDGDGDDGDGDDGDGDDGDDGDGDDNEAEEEEVGGTPRIAFGRSPLSAPEDAENQDASGSVKLVQVRSRSSMHVHVAGLEPGGVYTVNASMGELSETVGSITTREASARPSRCYSGGLSVPEEEAPAEEDEGGGAGDDDADADDADAGDDDADAGDDDADDDAAADDDDADDDADADDDDNGHRRGWHWGWHWGWRGNGHGNGRRNRGPSGSARVRLKRDLSEATYRITVRRLDDDIASVRLILADGTVIELDGRRGSFEVAEGQAEALNGAMVEVYTAAEEGGEETLALSGDVSSCYPRLDRWRERIAARRAGKGSMRIDTRRDDEMPFGVASLTDLEGAVITVVDADGAVVLNGTIDELHTFGRRNNDNEDEADDDEKVPDEEALEVVAEVVEEGAGAVFKLLEPHDASFLRGDTNDDGVVNLSDPVRVLSVLFQGGGTLYCEDSADANDDGIINLTDPILMLRTLFDGTAGISAPYPYRGFDPTPDELNCKAFEG